MSLSAVDVSRLVFACRSRVSSPDRLRRMLDGMSDYAVAVGLFAAIGKLGDLPDGATETDVRADADWIRSMAGVSAAAQ